MKITNYIIINVLLCCIAEMTSAQSSVLGNNRPASPPFSLGWFNTGGTTGPLDIRNDWNDVINFSTNTNKHVSIDANGNFSIGLTNSNNYYAIGTNQVLWHNGKIKSIYLGVNAGNSTMTATDNTLLGYSTGFVLTTGDSNVVVGRSAGASLTTAHKNTFVGFQAGYNCMILYSFDCL